MAVIIILGSVFGIIGAVALLANVMNWFTARKMRGLDVQSMTMREMNKHAMDRVAEKLGCGDVYTCGKGGWECANCEMMNK